MLELALPELTHLLDSRARALRARRWFYSSQPVPAALPARIEGVAQAAWQRLRAAAPLPAWRLLRRALSDDGTIKYVLDLSGAVVETVLIPSRRRSTVCVSSQAGCSRRCAFCATATLGFERQLTPAEILIQYAVARADAPAGAPVRNVVFMGMGEPLDNLEAVLATVQRLTEPGTPELAAEHVTVSTSGVAPAMERFLRASRARLALSLNATTSAQRQRLMPHTRRWPVRTLLEVLRRDARRAPGRRYFIEYVLWDGVNDSAADARRLAQLLAGLPAHVNLIPHNPFTGSGLRPPAPAVVLRFQQLLSAAGVRCLVRPSRGRDVAAACGQLAPGHVGPPAA